MRRRAVLLIACAALGGAGAGTLARPAPARAGVRSILGGLGGAGCKLVGTVGEGWWGTACNGVLGVGKKLVGGGASKAGKVAKVLASNPVGKAAGLVAIGAWVLGGAKWVIDHMASVISKTTTPTLTAGWFTGVYLEVEGIAVFFTVLFLIAVAVEAMVRSEMALLARATLVYLPMAALLTAVAAALTMLVLSAGDQLSSGLAGLAGPNAVGFLTGKSTWVVAGLTALDPFIAVMAGGLIVAAGLALWVEMLIREVGIYVVVAMMPVALAAMVWPARRVWAIRAAEILVALIFSKVAVVVVLGLGAAALGHAGADAVTRLLGGLALVVIGAFTPWVLLRLIPLAEVASAAVGHIRGQVHATAGVNTPEGAIADKAREKVGDWRNASGARNGSGASDEAPVAEMLGQMDRQRQTAEGENEAPSSEPVGAGVGAGAMSLNGDRRPSTSGRRSGEGESVSAQEPAAQPEPGWEQGNASSGSEPQWPYEQRGGGPASEPAPGWEQGNASSGSEPQWPYEQRSGGLASEPAPGWEQGNGSSEWTPEAPTAPLPMPESQDGLGGGGER